MRPITFIALFAWAQPAKSMEISTSITIKATPEKVWKVLTTFASYPEWNPFVTSLEGQPVVGKKIKVTAGGMNFQPTVLVFEKNRELKWKGKLLFAGIFDGTHRFVLTDNGDGTTRLEHSEKFNGILVPLMKKKLETETLQGFEDMNLKLKQRVEQAQ